MSKSNVAAYLANQLEVCGKSQKEVASDAGYERPNIMTMFKQGATRIPVDKAPAIAKAIGVDPAFFIRMVLAEYHPEMLKAIEETMGGLHSKHEAALLKIIREEMGGADPVIGSKSQEEAFRKSIRKIFV